MILVAPTERQLHDILRSSTHKWQISSLPEKHGCDVLILTKVGIIGFQRKTLPDLVASLQDGRLYYELSQLSSTATVAHSFLLVECDFHTTVDGESFTEANISVSSFRSIVAKFNSFGVGFIPTQSSADTLACCLSVSRYLASGRAEDLHRPKALSNEWGRVDARAYGVFLLQSFPGIGPKVAKAIYQHFGTVPIAWSVTPAELAQVPGVGRKRAEALYAALSPSAPAAGTSPH